MNRNVRVSLKSVFGVNVVTFVRSSLRRVNVLWKLKRFHKDSALRKEGLNKLWKSESVFRKKNVVLEGSGSSERKSFKEK